MANNVSWLDAARQTKTFKTTETTGVHVSHTNISAVRVTLAVTPTVSTTPAYSSGDLIGGKLSLTGAAQLAAGGGLIRSLVLTDLASQNADIDLILFDADPSGTTFTDNAAFDIADADLVKVVAVIPITAESILADNSVQYSNNLGVGFKLASGTTLYGAMVSRGTPTYASTSDLTLRLQVEQ